MRAGTDDREFTKQWKNMMTYHKGLFEAEDGLGMAGTAGKKDPPPVADLLIIAAELAVGAATGGIGLPSPSPSARSFRPAHGHREAESA